MKWINLISFHVALFLMASGQYVIFFYDGIRRYGELAIVSSWLILSISFTYLFSKGSKAYHVKNWLALSKDTSSSSASFLTILGNILAIASIVIYRSTAEVTLELTLVLTPVAFFAFVFYIFGIVKTLNLLNVTVTKFKE